MCRNTIKGHNRGYPTPYIRCKMTINNSSRALLILSVVLILFPPMFCKYPKWQIVFKVFAWCLIVFTAVMGPLAIYVKDTVFVNVPVSSRVVYDLSFAFLYVANIYICLNAIFQQKSLSKLLESCLDVLTESKEFMTYFGCFLLINSLNTVFIVLTQIKRTENRYYYLSVFVVEGFLAFRVVTALFIIFLLVNHVKTKFITFNQTILPGRNGLRQEHNRLCDTAEQINELFGAILMWAIFYFITSFLRHGVFITGNTEDGISLASIVRCLWICSYAFQAGYLAHIGEQTSKANRKTVAICYELLAEMPLSDGGKENGQAELFLLALQAQSRKAKLTASGLVRLDHSMILFMITTFCTYFIVVMQFLSISSNSRFDKKVLSLFNPIFDILTLGRGEK